MSWLEKINQMKKNKEKTTEEIAQMSGIPKGTLNKLFAGQTKDPQLSTVRAVVHCLGYTLDDLVDENKKSPATEEPLAEDDQERKRLLKNYDDLNEEGREKLLEQSEFLVSSGKYKRNIKNNPPNLGKEA